MQRYGGATDNVERRMRYTSWITKAISTHSELVIMIFFSTATLVTRKRLSISLYLRCISCYLCYHVSYVYVSLGSHQLL